MASAAQVRANRSNARKSTGPRTAEGKERASQNAVRHGLLAREAVIVGEDPTEFDAYREGMLATLAPVGPVEAMLAERLQNIAFAALDEGEPTELLEARLREWKQHKGSERDRTACGVLDENTTLGKLVVEDFAEARVLDRMLMYERRIESSLYRTMAELRREREARQATADAEEVPHSEPGPGEESRRVATEGTEGHREERESEGKNAAIREPLVCSPDSCLSASVTSVSSVAQTPILAADREAGTELASFGANAQPGEGSSLKCRVSSDGCGPDTPAEPGSLSPGGSDKRSLRSLSIASSQGRDHRQTSLSMPPGVEGGPLSTSRDLAATSCETKPIAGEVPSLKCQVSSDGSDLTLRTSHLKLQEKITPYGVTTNEEGQGQRP